MIYCHARGIIKYKIPCAWTQPKANARSSTSPLALHMTAGKDHQLVTNTMQIEDLPCLQNSSLQRTCVDNTRTWHGPEVVVIHDVIGKHE